MVKTVGDEFYGSALTFNTFILVSTYFGKKKFKIDALYHLNLPHPLLLQIDKNGSEMLMKPWFDIPQGTFFLDLRPNLKRLVKKL